MSFVTIDYAPVEQELIVTQWDVNVEDNELMMLTSFELIVTQWDVNY